MFALLGGEYALLRRAFALPGGAHEDVDAGQRVRVVIALGGGVELLERVMALIGETIALQRRAIAGVCAHVALVGDGQTRAGGPIAIVGCLLAISKRPLVLDDLGLADEMVLLSIERPVGGGTIG